MLLHCVDRLMLCPGDVCGELCRGWGGVVTVVDGPTLGWSPTPLSTLTPILTLIPGLILFISCVNGIIDTKYIATNCKCHYFVYPFLWQFQFQDPGIYYKTKEIMCCVSVRYLMDVSTFSKLSQPNTNLSGRQIK